MRPSMRRTPFLAALVAAVVLAACGGTPAGSGDAPGGGASGTPSDGEPAATAGSSGSDGSAGATPATSALTACDLLTDADVDEILDRTVVRKQPGLALGVYQDGCEWFFEDGDDGLKQLVVGTITPGGGDLWARSYAGIAAEAGFEPVDGIGEAALRQGTGSFSALEGDRIVDVFFLHAGTPDRAAQDETAKALLTRALARAAGAPIAGSGDGPSPSADTGTVGGTDDVCALLTAAQIEEFAAVPLLVARPQPAGCRWVLDTGSLVPEAHAIDVDVTRSGGRARFDSMSALERVPGIGDAAARLGGSTDGTVWALRGDTLVELRYALPISTSDADPIVLPLLELIVNGL